MWLQRELRLQARPRGLHLITREVEQALPELDSLRTGLAHLFLLHTSAALAINENASPDVLTDLEADLNRLVPEQPRAYRHNEEGPDDMPAHTKSVLVGPGHIVPVRDGKFWFGTWQGIYLCEFRERGGSRRLAVTLHGE